MALSKTAFCTALAALMFALILYAVKHGALDVSWREVIQAIFGYGQNDDLKYIIWNLRLPRIIAAVVVGACLAVTGVVLQNILNNPLASSFTLGISHGAAFGASFAILVMGAGGLSHIGSGVVLSKLHSIAAGAFAGSLAASGVILLFSFFSGITAQGLILVGIAMSSFFNACTMLLQFFSTDSQLAAAVFWTFGDLGKGGWTEAFIITGVLIAGCLALIKFSWDYDVIRWGQATAEGLGVDVKKVRLISLLITSLMAATATAYYGVIGFVGLIAPHMVRLVFRHSGHLFLITASGLLGGVFLLFADILGQSIVSPLSLPVGILTAFTGVPVFLFLLLKRSVKDA
ncbi:transport system permease protein [Denitrovibrio acetiphilus DSM 12809]|uniref:Transport system permease protein n=1 Tax=Denitrovibrio acetiphilus (strain DSM 12809 / NBRC 114555 / N2460) TaxID=522772 RepID=D4H653_DENA2|nr:iron ABC transporter permease [Denitrovibrio acetiphilus]ADD67699.1 transport system permease protein [Denitrovibrio acetiphilus DSM 12809]